MKFMTTWSARPGVVRDAVARFLATQGVPPAGVTQLGRWHATDLSGGYVLYEAGSFAAIFEAAALWADLLELDTVPVIEDAEAGPILAKVFSK